MFSLHRKREHYIVLYVWKILKDRLPMWGLNPLSWRRGRLCYIKGTSGSTQGVRTQINNSFTHNGPRLFSCFPQDLRDTGGVSLESFERKLDKWPISLPDHPPIPGYSIQYRNTLPQLSPRGKTLQAEYSAVSGGPPQMSITDEINKCTYNK